MLTIIIPVLNEEKLIVKGLSQIKKIIEMTKGLSSKVQVVVSDAGSSDQTIEVAKKICEEMQFSFITNKIELPSIGKTITQGIEKAQNDTIFILPIDCEIDQKHIEIILQYTDKTDFYYGAFSKQYENNNTSMQLYAFLQNQFRSKLFSQFVWTNGLFMRKSVLDHVNIPTDLFMEDVILSDSLRKLYSSNYVDHPIIVGTRLYDKNGPIRRIIINATVMILYRLGIKNKLFLKKVYKLQL
ncbi:MAG: glycosyltransferase [Bacteriovoracaceae bacterium]|jgi:glycosyltransferase involved in cell wall biosynthesis|nr:glycosyltransferase [Bacteriovoracaceae bacterium]